MLLGDGTLVELALGPAQELEELARDWRATLGQPLASRGLSNASEPEERGPSKGAGRRLRELVLDPVLAAVGDATTLHVCLDDFLHVVPIGALPMEDGDVVGDRYVIVNEVSFARLLAERRQVGSEPGLLAVGDVAFGGLASGSIPTEGYRTRSGSTLEFVPLEETRGEAEYAAALFESELGREPVLLLEEGATKSAFHRLAPGKRYLHVATHGWFAPETASSTLDTEGGDDGELGSRR